MKEQEKQIEEMAKVIKNTWLVDLEGNTFDVCEVLDKVDIESIARELYEQGYRKIDKDSVVLSREEYEKLKSLYDSQQGAIMTSSIGDLPLTVEGLRKAVDEIARLMGVQTELQELNAKYYNEAKDLRREVNRLKAHAKINDEHLHIRIKNQASKETAEKIYSMLKKYFGNSSVVTIYDIHDKIEKLVGVKIKE